MTVFDTMSKTLFADPNLAVSSEYRAGGEGIGMPVRVIKRDPDQVGNFGEGRFIQGTVLIESQAIDTPAPAIGDTFTIGATTYTVRGDPIRDNDRRVWTSPARQS